MANTVHLVGLGGAGINTIETFLKDARLGEALKIAGVRFSCLALDVADQDLKSLQETYNHLIQKMKEGGIPLERLSLIAKPVKSPNPGALFDFLRKYPEYCKAEGAKVPMNYKPWIEYSTEIPPLEGGVGRKRGLAKAVYAMNYYDLGTVDNALNTFKEKVSSSTIQPIVFLVYGLGGGSGSGMAIDFARHLRRRLGSGVPIIGIAILPCPGDDPLAKGTSSYVALNELGLLLNRISNEKVKKSYGDVYENPFSAFMVMPLAPIYGRAKSMEHAKKVLDKSLVDAIFSFMSFDLSDLLTFTGSTLNTEGKWVHTLSLVKMRYPVDAYIELTKMNLLRLEKVGELRSKKLSIFESISRILFSRHSTLASIYRQYLSSRDAYKERTFENDLQQLIRQRIDVESEYRTHIRSAHEKFKQWIDEFAKPVSLMNSTVKEGTIEARIVGFAKEAINIMSDLSEKYSAIHEMSVNLQEQFTEGLPSAQGLTSREVKLLKDLMNVLKLADISIAILRLYLENKAIAEELSVRLAGVDEKERSRIQRILAPELVTLYTLISSMLDTPSTEAKSLDSYKAGIFAVDSSLKDENHALLEELESIDMVIVEKGKTMDKITESMARMKMPLSARRKQLENDLASLKGQLAGMKPGREGIAQNLAGNETILSEYLLLNSHFEGRNDYETAVSNVLDITTRNNLLSSQVTREGDLSERVVELTDGEQNKILEKILLEQEDSLSDELLLQEIVDRRHLEDSIRSLANLLSMPSTMGLTDEYKTDAIWVTVSAPPGIWTIELTECVLTSLSGHTSRSVEQSVAMRQIRSPDPWTVRFLVVASRATPTLLDQFKEMKRGYEQSTEGERLLHHSFLIEQGVIVTDNGNDGLGHFMST